MPPLIDVTGKQFNQLTVISKTDKRSAGGGVLWKCKCTCGNVTCVEGQSLRTGHTKSCGRCHPTNFKHGNYSNGGSSIYNIWTAMISRCCNKNNSAYERYGGRGIKVCERWLTFENFIVDMGPRPAKLTVERIDNNKGYDPENCKWDTRRVQARNKTSTKLTLDDAIQIVILRKEGLTYKEIGLRYSIGLDHAWQVCKGKLWPEARELAEK
jgi:hypothetical protein